MAKVGFIGLGVMGSQMVNRLLSKGHSVIGYNRTRAKAEWLVGKGMQWADSPRAVVSASDYTFAMVTNAAAIQAITEGPDGLLAGNAALLCQQHALRKREHLHGEAEVYGDLHRERQAVVADMSHFGSDVEKQRLDLLESLFSASDHHRQLSFGQSDHAPGNRRVHHVGPKRPNFGS